MGLLGLSAGLTYQIQGLIANSISGSASYGDELASLYTATTFGGALVGILLGLAQSIPENRGDKWGFLAHRPVRWSTLFWGKVVSGVVLYALATGIPLAGALVWMLVPGHYPLPVDWSIALPGVVDLLCGLSYYFAALLTGMRDARWYGSRALGFGAAFVCSAMSSSVASFWPAVALSALGILVVGAAAWGTFTTGSRYEAQPRASRMALSVSIGAGIVLVGGIAVAIIMSFLQDTSSVPYTDYTVTSDGAIAQTVSEDSQIVEMNDLESKPIEKYKDALARSQKLRAGVISPNAMGVGEQERDTRYRSTSRLYIKLRPSRGAPPMALDPVDPSRRPCRLPHNAGAPGMACA